jgi:hypothetical protein
MATKKVTRKKGEGEDLSPAAKIEQKMEERGAKATLELMEMLGTGYTGYAKVKKIIHIPGRLPRNTYVGKATAKELEDIEDYLLGTYGSGDYELEMYEHGRKRDLRFEANIPVSVGVEDDDDDGAPVAFGEGRVRIEREDRFERGMREIRDDMVDRDKRREDRIAGAIESFMSSPVLQTIIEKAFDKPPPPPKDDFTQKLLVTLIENQAQQKTDSVAEINKIMGATMGAVQGAYGDVIKFALDKATEVKESDSPSDESIGAILGNMAKEFVKGRQLPEPAAEGQPGVRPSPGRPGSTMPAPGKPAPGAGEALDRTPIRNACIARFHAYLAGSDPSCTEESVCNFWNEHLNVEESDILISMLDDEDDSVESQEKLNGFFDQYPRAGEVVMLITQNTPKVMKLLERFAGDEDEVIDPDQPEEVDPAPMGESPVSEPPIVEAEIVEENKDEETGEAPGTGGSQSDGDPDQPEPGRDEAAG